MDSRAHHDGVYHSTLEVATAEHEPRPQVANDSDLEVLQGAHTSGSTMHHDGSGWNAYKGYGAVAQETQHGSAAQDKRRYCFGLSRRAFWILIAVAAVVVIGAVAGGVAGGLLAHKQTDGASPMPNGNGTTIPGDGGGGTTNIATPLLGSQLAATNWTDSTGLVRRAVFYQSDGALLLRHTHDVNNSWIQVNISDQFAAETGNNMLGVRAATPLAVAAIPWLGTNFSLSASLFYLNLENQVRELVSSDDTLSAWTHGSSWSTDFDADADSRLSAVPYYCPSCPNHVCVIFQDANRNIVSSCDGSWDTQNTVTRAYPGSPFSMIQFSSNGGLNVSDVDELRLFYFTDAEIVDYMYNLDGNKNWLAGMFPHDYS